MKKKVLSLLLAFFMVFCTLPATTFANVDGQAYDFADMPNNWSAAALKKAVDNGLLRGYVIEGKTLINADAPLKRAEMAAVVNRAFGAVKAAELKGVTDVPSTAWYASDMAKAVMMGTFMKDTKMHPESNITRQESFVVLARAFKITSNELGYKALENYFDKSDIAAWAKKDLNAMVEAGYIQGFDGKLKPNANIRRAEFAVVIDNLVKQYIDKPGEVTNIATSGNVLVRVPGVTLKNLIIKGDLIIADGVKEGNLTLDNVKVEGRTVVRGGGENSIIIKGSSNLGKVVICKVDGKVRIAVEGRADVEVIYVADGSDNVLVEGIVETLEVAGDNITAIATKAILTNAIVSGNNSTIVLRTESTLKDGIISGSSSGITVDKGATVEKIIINSSNAEVKGSGTVKNVEVKTDGNNASITTPNTKIVTQEGAEGITAAGGAPVGSGTSATNNNAGTWIVTPPASSGGGGSSSAKISAINIATNVDVTSGVDNDAVVEVTLTTATAGADIYYTIDGSIPTASSTKYTAPFNVDTDNTEGETVTIKAIGIKSGYTNSAVAEKGIVFKAIEAEFAGGDGTAENPYQVATAEQLDNVRNHLDAHFVQTADIDLGVAPWDEGEGWKPIGEDKDYPTYGDPFCGIYDGQNYTITGLTINRPLEKNIGLFGYICGKVVNYELVQQAELKEIQLNNVTIIGQQNVGSLVGQSSYNSVITGCSAAMIDLNYSESFYGTIGGLIGINCGVVTDCHSTGDILGTTGVGGLVGVSSGTISRSSADVEISGQGWMGGLVGNNNTGNIESCYASGNIIGWYGMGGLVGQHFNGTISNTYATGNVTSHTRTQDFYIGGLIGSIGPGTIDNSYAIGAISATGEPITGPTHIGGLVGKLPDGGSQPVFNRCYYDTNTSGQSDTGKGIPKTTSEMTQQSTFAGWDFTGDNGVWSIEEGVSYPYLQWQGNDNIPCPPSGFAGGDGTAEEPYQVATAEQLDNVRNHLDKYFIQTADIDLAAYLDVDGAGYNDGAGWEPIGTNDSPFTGSYDGNNKTISNLKIARPEHNYVGLFGKNEGDITNVSLLDVDVSGNQYIGGLVGQNHNGTVCNSNVSGSVTGTYYAVGGLVGQQNGGSVTGCFSSGTVSITDQGVGGVVGGLVGNSSQSSISDSYSISTVNGGNNCTGGLIGHSVYSTINKCYATGNVTGVNIVGGLVGDNNSMSEITNSYATGSVSGSDDYIGGLVGRNYSQITNSYSIGLVNGETDYKGGLVGRHEGGTYINSYWDTQTSGQATSAGGIGYPTSAMIMETNGVPIYVDWDFANTWAIDTAPRSYPYLQWQGNENIPYPPVQNYYVGGTVYDFDGGENDLKGITVTLYAAADTSFEIPLGTGTTDINGNYGIDNRVANGSYVLRIEASTGKYAESTANVEVNGADITNVSITLQEEAV